MVDDLLREVMVARQPIVDAELEVVGYQLLFHDDRDLATDDAEVAGVRAAATILSDGLLALGRELITDLDDAFVDVPVPLLLAGTLLDLPADGLVLQILPDAADVPGLRAAVDRHRAAGFRFALAGVVPDDPRVDLLDRVELVKVDTATLGQKEALRLVRELSHQGATVVAERVEEPETFDRFVGAGAAMFQGFFFTRPRPVRAMRPLGLPPAHLALLRELALDEVDLDRVEELIRSDLTLSDRFLRLVDVIGGWRGVGSVRHGLVLLGTRRLHRWVSLLVMSSVTSDAPGELLTTASVRARYCEELQELRGDAHGLDAFALGMFSVLGGDGRIPELVLRDVPVRPEVRVALLGEPGELRDLLDIALAAERAAWPDLVAIGRRLGLEPRGLAKAHVAALQWSNQIRAAAGQPVASPSG